MARAVHVAVVPAQMDTDLRTLQKGFTVHYTESQNLCEYSSGKIYQHLQMVQHTRQYVAEGRRRQEGKVQVRESRKRRVL